MIEELKRHGAEISDREITAISVVDPNRKPPTFRQTHLATTVEDLDDDPRQTHPATLDIDYDRLAKALAPRLAPLLGAKLEPAPKISPLKAERKARSARDLYTSG